ncbi:MAG: DUF882 domain-containing protein [Proteobacteria bacterium]|nr:DUF882 domain-containing protein [Pseudomonadota bacterium]
MIDRHEPPGRRGFLLFAASATASLILPARSALAAKPKRPPAVAPSSPVPVRPTGVRALKLQIVNTGERWEGVYWRDGNYVPEATRKLDALLRDYRAGAVTRMDAKLYDQLWELHQRLGSSEPWRVISAYRSPRTNAAARKSHGGVARNSFHISGRAVDVDLTDRSVRAIRQAAVSLQAGGVGQYPRSDFVHIDTGPVRTWG